MHLSTLFSLAALCGLTVSAPTNYSNTTTSTHTISTSTTSSTTACPTTPEAGTYCGFINPEDPCAPQPGGYGPRMSPDTVSTFQHYTPFQSLALNASTPNNYTRVFKNLTAAASTTDYVGLYLLESYNVSACAAKCNEVTVCNSFNIYVERDPEVNPSKNDSTAPTVYGYWCPNPASMTNWKCALWGGSIDNSTAKNTEETQWREDFQVVVAGSNGYVNSAYYNSTAWKVGSGANGGSVVAYTGAAGGAEVSRSTWWVLVLGVCVLQFV